MRASRLAFATIAALALAASSASAQHDMHGKSGEHAMSGWKELDAFHMLMMETWHPAAGKNDLAPARAKAGAMADAAQKWAASTPPAACADSATRRTVATLSTESRAFADLVAQSATPDSTVKRALRDLHERFESVESTCKPGMPVKKG